MKKRKLAAPIVISVLVGLWLLGYAVLIFLVPAIPLWICGKYNPWRGLRVAVGKPIDLDELVLRVGALLRRANIASEKKLTVGSLTMNADEMSAAVNGEEIPLTVREFNILFKLLSYPRHTFSRAQLMDEFWGLDSDTSLRAVDVYITKLRDKFSGCGDFKIVTVHGLGYKAVPV